MDSLEPGSRSARRTAFALTRATLERFAYRRQMSIGPAV